jgi:hypothetical protein
MKTFRMIFKLLGFAFALGLALGTPTPIWADEIPSPRLMIRSGSEQIYEGAAVLSYSELGTLVRAHPDLMIPAVRFPEGLPLLKERAVIPSSLQLKDQTLPGFATVNAKLLGTTRDGGQIIRYDICGGYGETSCHASVVVSLVRIFYSIP